MDFVPLLELKRLKKTFSIAVTGLKLGVSYFGSFLRDDEI